MRSRSALRMLAEMTLSRGVFVLVLVLVWSSEFPISAEPGESPVTASVNVQAEDLLAQPVGANWTSYNGDYTGQRYSSLREINSGNVRQLQAAWVFHPGNSQNLEVTPVVVRGVMFVTSANHVFGLEAENGQRMWNHTQKVSWGTLEEAGTKRGSGGAV